MFSCKNLGVGIKGVCRKVGLVGLNLIKFIITGSQGDIIVTSLAVKC
jgi:hypothetical protein